MNLHENKHKPGCTCKFCENKKRAKHGFDSKKKESEAKMESILERRLTAKSRNALPSSDFVFPGSRKFPIEDKSHARNALARASAKGGDTESKVRAAVHSKYPDIGENAPDRLVDLILDSCGPGGGCPDDIGFDEEEAEVNIGHEINDLSNDLLALHGEKPNGCLDSESPGIGGPELPELSGNCDSDSGCCPLCGSPRRDAEIDVDIE